MHSIQQIVCHGRSPVTSEAQPVIVRKAYCTRLRHMQSLRVALASSIAFAAMSSAPLEPNVLAGSMGPASAAPAAKSDPRRSSIIARAQVWESRDVAQADIKKGPEDPRAFAFEETVTCTYLKKDLQGKSPKFACVMGQDDELKVKYGGTNGEVYGEVAATRLLWALGFGADHMYPVKVICRQCPSSLNGVQRSGGESLFDPAAIERKMPGTPFHPDEGWSWPELDMVNEAAGGASRAQRDALKLLAVFLQHTDTKQQQQRLMCLNEPKTEGVMPCEHPFMMLNDVGLTFGRANTFNNNTKGGMNLAAWSKTPVWKDATNCVGNLPKSMTGTLDNPPITEAGRQFLADLMTQLSDAQIHDLFEVSRVTLRLRDPGDVSSGFPTVDEWVNIFKQKREQIVARRCS